MPGVSTTIRTARAKDAPALASLAERTFREAFAAQNTPEDLQLYCANAFSERHQLDEINDPRIITLLLEQSSSLAGYAQVNIQSVNDSVPGHSQAELSRFYLLQEYHGRGVARALMMSVLARAASTGAAVLWLGVWEQNPRAIAFYRKYGFDVVGEKTFLVGTDLQRDLVLSVQLEGARS